MITGELQSQIDKVWEAFRTGGISNPLTVRNWLIGFYIVEFRQNGEDRATYGAKLFDNLAAKLNVQGLVSAELSRCRQFYSCYPQILGALTQEFENLIPFIFIGFS